MQNSCLKLTTAQNPTRRNIRLSKGVRSLMTFAGPVVTRASFARTLWRIQGGISLFLQCSACYTRSSSDIGATRRPGVAQRHHRGGSCRSGKRGRCVRIKTDRRDAINLAKLHHARELVPIWAPDPVPMRQSTVLCARDWRQCARCSRRAGNSAASCCAIAIIIPGRFGPLMH